MFQEVLKIPKERIAVLVGVKGRTKREIEKKTRTRLSIDSDEGDVMLTAEESIDVFIAKPIILAIGRGFNPQAALHLLDEDTQLEIIDITDFSKKSRNRLRVMKARLIGSKGKAKRSIEVLTHTDIEVYGKTCSILGLQEDVLLAKQAITNLLQGSKHGNVYAFIDRQKRMKQ